MIYIAAPYSHSDKDVVTYRTKIVCHYSAYLMKKGYNCVSPITIGTGIFVHATLPTDFEFWQHLSYGLLERCDMLCVLRINGWKESIGVQAEIEFATKNKMKIEYVDIDYLLKEKLIDIDGK